MLHMDMGEKHIYMAVYLNIKKAFDTINHKILFKKLQKLKIGQNTLALLESYLDNRKQCVLYKKNLINYI